MGRLKLTERKSTIISIYHKTSNVILDGQVRLENAPEAPVIVEKPYLKTPYGIINLGIVVWSFIISIIVFSSQLHGTSTGYWASFLALNGIIFNGIFFTSELLKRKFVNNVILTTIQMLFSLFWTFFFFTCAIDSAIWSARGKNTSLGFICLLAFVNMLFYGANVYFRFQIIKQDIEQWRTQRKK